MENKKLAKMLVTEKCKKPAFASFLNLNLIIHK